MQVRGLHGKKPDPTVLISVSCFMFKIVGDLFTELVFMDFSMSSWQFWAVMLLDVFLLIMRDADLYDDFAIYVRKHAGRLGELVMRLGELLVGPDMASAEHAHAFAKNPDRYTNTGPTEKQKAQVKRELVENCVVSEMLASVCSCFVVLPFQISVFVFRWRCLC